MNPVSDVEKQRKKEKEEKKAKRLEKKKVKLMKRLAEKRLAFATAAGGGAVLLIILLVLTTCAGFCLLVGGTIALIDGAAWGILGILAGGLIGWLSIRGISRASKRNKEKPKKEPAQ